MNLDGAAGAAVTDFASRAFWMFLLVALLLLVPLGRTAWRRAVQALLNVAFLALLLGVHAAWVAGALVLVWALLRAVQAGGGLRWLLLPAGLIALGLFVTAKRPDLAAAAGLDVRLLNPVLAAVGFSYVLLRLVDVARAVVEGAHPAPSLVATVNYLVPFHMLAAGPIQSFDQFVAGTPAPRAPDFAQVLTGVERVVAGLFKKYVLAFTIEKLLLTGFHADGPYFLLEVQVYFLWLYLDFSAYSDIAVGLGALLGIATPENFNRPYLARNLMDFWERWHISLSQWIRRHLFLPLQLALARRAGGRHPLLPASVAFTLAFLLCGLWHGLTVRFLLWGALHAVALVTVNAWRFLLQRRLGSRGLKTYLENRLVRAAAVVVTYEYVAFSLLLVGWHAPAGAG